MCACEGSFVCARCKGTPFDPRYQEDAHEPMSPMEFDALVETFRSDDEWPQRFWA